MVMARRVAGRGEREARLHIYVSLSARELLLWVTYRSEAESEEEEEREEVREAEAEVSREVEEEGRAGGEGRKEGGRQERREEGTAEEGIVEEGGARGKLKLCQRLSSCYSEGM